MDLTEEEKAEVKSYLDRGEPLPDSYRFRLFREPREAELIWPGKTHEVTQAILPFQSIEQLDEPRAEANGKATLDLFSRDAGSGRQAGGWSNKLIWGDNKLVLSSLKSGHMRREIEKAGGLKLVYIDPPFDVGADFSFEIDVGDGEILLKHPTTIEEIAYRDTWGRGRDSFLSMMNERIRLIASLMTPDGLFYLHCDWRTRAHLRAICDEVFGKENFHNDIAWIKNSLGAKGRATQFPRNQDTILFYSKSPDYTFNRQMKEEAIPLEMTRSGISPPAGYKQDAEGRFYWTSPKGDYSDESIKRLETEGRVERTKSGSVRIKYFVDRRGNELINTRTVDDTWSDIDLIFRSSDTTWGYDTQKPEALLDRIVSASSKPGDLVGDFFCGSGTTLAVAEKLGRKWIGCDLGRFAIHTSRNRLIGVQRQLKTGGKPYRAFEILNIGKYERQWLVGIDPTLPEAQRRAVSAEMEARYVELILTAYGAQAAEQSPPFHGRKGGAPSFW